MWIATHRQGAQLPGSADLITVREASRQDPVREAIREQLKDLERGRESSEWEVPKELTPRNQGMETMASEKDHLAEFEDYLVKVRFLAEAFRNVGDLRAELSRQLSGKDPKGETLVAIFLEWHRRSPLEAFDEMAKFPDVLDRVVESGITHILPLDEVVAQLGHPERSTILKDNMLIHHVSWLARGDRLEDVQALYLGIAPEERSLLLGELMASWRPDDGPEAVRFLMESADQEFRRQILDYLASDRGDGEIWSEQFSSALVSRNLGDSENLRPALLANIAASTTLAPPRRSGLLGIPELDVRDLLATELVEDKDYPELFRRGEINASSLHSLMLARVPGASSTPEDFTVALFQALAPYDPQAARDWAVGKLSKEVLVRASTEVVLKSEDPRCSRLGYLMEHLPTAPAKATDFRGEQVEERFRDWSRSAPAEAEKVISRVPPDSLLKPVASGGATGEGP